MLEKQNPKSYELTTVLLYRKNNPLVTLNNGCQNLLILALASGFIIVENLSAFFFLFLWILWLHQFWTMSSLVFPQGSSSSCHVKYLIHLNRLMFAKVEKNVPEFAAWQKVSSFSSWCTQKIWEADLQLQGNHLITKPGRFCGSLLLCRKETLTIFHCKNQRAVRT